VSRVRNLRIAPDLIKRAKRIAKSIVHQVGAATFHSVSFRSVMFHSKMKVQSALGESLEHEEWFAKPLEMVDGCVGPTVKTGPTCAPLCG
jgi:hypothetical protein